VNILVTGYSGFLGKEVVNILNDYGYSLIFLGKKKKKKNYFFCDLNNTEKLKLILNDLNPDVIVNLAAVVDFNKKYKQIYKINSLCPYEIAKFCKKRNIHLIHASSISVHGIKKIYSSKTRYNPISNYAKSKLEADILIAKSRCKYTILRFNGIYGKNGPDHLGINKFIRLASRRKIIKFNGNKDSLRNYIFVKDAAKVILHIIKYKKYGIFYVGGETLSFKSMLNKINKILNQSIFFEFSKKKIILDNQIVKFKKLINYTTFAKSLNLIK